ncbi:MAG TPA: hypothetical protein VFB96_16810 [Pirellulaceae bacterium]|nr:hypothetical protein [Pirellulaceae bacterium]
MAIGIGEVESNFAAISCRMRNNPRGNRWIEATHDHTPPQFVGCGL